MLSLLKAIGGVFLLLLLWVGVQEWVRRKSPHSPDDCDESQRAHGCHHCVMADTCASKPEEDEEC